jgi:hypothetical protein
LQSLLQPPQCSGWVGISASITQLSPEGSQKSALRVNRSQSIGVQLPP